MKKGLIDKMDEPEKKVIPLSDIIIRQNFLNSTPSDEKMTAHRRHWKTHHTQEVFIVLDKNNILVDGYIQYLILKENNIEWAGVEIVEDVKEYKKLHKRKENKTTYPSYKEMKTIYVFGKHLNSNDEKVYTWRIPPTWKSFGVKIGDTIFCYSKCGVVPVVVTDIQALDKPPIDRKIKCVARARKYNVSEE